MAYFTKKNAKIFYELYGDGDRCITLINGYTRPSSDFKLLGSFLAEQGRRVLAFDNRGSGRTEAALDFSIHDIVRDVVDLWDALGIVQSHVLGISMGGFIAQFLAVAAEEKINSLCLVSTSMQAGIFPVRFAWPTEESEITNRLMKYFHPNFVVKNTLLIQAMAKQIAKDNKDGDFERKAKAQRLAIAHAHLDTEALKKLSIPCFILHGRDDEIIPISESENLHKHIRNSKTHFYEDTGHMLLVEQRSDFYSRLKDYYRGF